MAVAPPYVPPRVPDPVRKEIVAPEPEPAPTITPPRRSSLVPPTAAPNAKPSYLESTTASRMSSLLAPLRRMSKSKDDLQKMLSGNASSLQTDQDYDGDQRIFEDF
jgi:hypothetical protein